jgi:hypothetical protein
VRGVSRATAIACILGPAGALLAVWLPPVLHYWVETPEIVDDVVAELRQVPGDSVLDRLDPMRLDPSPPDSNSRAIAEEMLAGRYHTREGAVVPVSLEATDANMQIGSVTDQLQASSLIVADALLDAYRDTSDDRYFDAALESVLSWSRFERNAWVPIGFLWNDHAIAARVLVLTRLWREYRKRPGFDSDRAAEILAFVARSVVLLARPSHYTVRTNHGIMQDLALLHAGIAFPRLPDAQQGTRVALERLAMHLPFYVTANGVVLEHSVGYQEFAIHLLRNALDYIDLLGVAAPAGLREKYQAAECLQRHLTRPDMSLPLYGDTRATVRAEWLIKANAAVTCGTQAESRIDDDFGLASLRNFGAPETQFFMAWENFASRAHKHDDELAMWLWINGQDWWSSSGYWPYGDADHEVAISWRGANAPHAVGEARPSDGDSRLLHSLRGGPVQMLDVQRTEPDGRLYRRQALGIGSVGVLVLDFASGGSADARFESVWSLVPGIAVRPLRVTPAAYELSDARSGRVTAVYFFGADQEVSQLFGSRYPFGGLVARDGIIRSVNAFVVTAPFESWSVALWAPVVATSRSAGAPTMVAWDGPEQWSLSLPGVDGIYLIARNGSELDVTLPKTGRRSWPLESGPAIRPLRERATGRYLEAAALYPPFDDYIEYRERVTVGIGVLFVAQFAGLGVLSLLRVAQPLRATAVALAWALTGWWLYYSYLA